MSIFLGILVFLEFSLAFRLPEKVAEFAAPFHHACRDMAPLMEDTDLRNSYRSLVCGSSLSDSDLKLSLKKTGLLHLIVVSGSHFLLIEKIFVAIGAAVPRLKLVLWPALILFALANRLQPIIIRALLSLVLRKLSDHCQLGWPKTWILTLAGFAAIGFCRGRTDMISLLMSWICALVIQVLICHEGDERPLGLIRRLKSNTAIYLMIAPALLGASIPHPLSILCNLSLGPLIGAVLFPASLMAFALPWLCPLTDMLWRLLQSLLDQLQAWIPSGAVRCEISPVILLAYTLILTAVAWRSECAEK